MKLFKDKFGESRVRKAERLMHERRDRELTYEEQEFFMDAIRDEESLFPTVQESARCLNLLQSIAIEPEIQPSFDDRVIRMARLEKGRAGLRYWAPALVGCAVACLVLLSALQMVLRTANPELNPYTGTESRLVKPHTRSLELLEEPKLNR